MTSCQINLYVIFFLNSELYGNFLSVFLITLLLNDILPDFLIAVCLYCATYSSGVLIMLTFGFLEIILSVRVSLQ